MTSSILARSKLDTLLRATGSVDLRSVPVGYPVQSFLRKFPPVVEADNFVAPYGEDAGTKAETVEHAKAMMARRSFMMMERTSDQKIMGTGNLRTRARPLEFITILGVPPSSRNLFFAREVQLCHICLDRQVVPFEFHQLQLFYILKESTSWKDKPRQKEDTKSSRRVTTPSIALRVQLDGAICDVVCPLVHIC